MHVPARRAWLRKPALCCGARVRPLFIFYHRTLAMPQARSASSFIRRLLNLENAIRILLVLSIVLNFSLARRIRLLETAIRAIKSQNQLAVGNAVRPVEVLTADGHLERVVFDDVEVPTLLYVMSPTCVFCEYNLPT
jgi:hypothetical protein